MTGVLLLAAGVILLLLLVAACLFSGNPGSGGMAFMSRHAGLFAFLGTWWAGLAACGFVAILGGYLLVYWSAGRET